MYMDSNDLLNVYNFKKKIRLGNCSDGGYVVCELDGEYDCYISCGIANEESFTRDFLNKYKYIEKNNSFAFDGTIKDYPWDYTKNITFMKKNINSFNDNKNTNLKDLINKYENIFLSIDIEGAEYPWLLSMEEEQLKKFKQIIIEFHGLYGDGYEDDDTKHNDTKYNDKLKCFEKLNKTHYIMHAHGNNLAPMKHSIPYVLELTYVNKTYFSIPPIKNMKHLLIQGLDFPNNPNQKDYELNLYPFTNMRKNNNR